MRIALQQNMSESPDSPSTIKTKCSFFNVHTRIYVALYDEKQAQRMAQHALKTKYIIIPVSAVWKRDHDSGIEEENFTVSSLIEIYKFDEMANQMARRNADHKLVYTAGCSVRGQIKVVFLIGCHMIMSLGLDAEHVHNIFKSFDEFFVRCDESQVNALVCWRALHRAACASWINFQERFDLERGDERTINMEEFIHYSR